ncbi:MAG: helix-turn-helix domain-containing protein [Clostridia bacterium]|nr:helix-turn-helix domain-containing protein [Clostridia bacterium]NCC43252.1 helix-turn-helix domain-containing protein [Clostridia bacterium]
MANLSYTFTDLSDDHSERQHLRYISSSSFGNDWNSVFHSHECSELFYLTDGEGWLCTDEGNVPIKKNQMVIVNPKVRHTERSSAKNQMHYIVLGIDNLQFHFNNDDVFSSFRVFPLETHREVVLPLLLTILKELQKKRPSYEEICQHYLAILLLQVKRITGQDFSLSVPNPIPYECEKAKNYIEQNFREDITLETLSNITHWDKFYFSHQFSKAYGISPINYLLIQRIDHSKNLLSTTDYTITQIAESSGFSSQNYFSQIFRKTTGISPRDFRKKNSPK